MVIKMLIELRRKMCEQSENSNKKIGNTRKYQIEVTEMKNASTTLSNTLKGYTR